MQSKRCCTADELLPRSQIYGIRFPGTCDVDAIFRNVELRVTVPLADPVQNGPAAGFRVLSLLYD